MARVVLRSDYFLGILLSSKLDFGYCRHVVRWVAEEGWRGRTSGRRSLTGKSMEDSFWNTITKLFVNCLKIFIQFSISSDYRKLNRKRQQERTSRKQGKHTHASKLLLRKRQHTPRPTQQSLRATSPARATSCSWTRSEATRMTIHASACPSVATPSRTRWAHSPRTSPPKRTTTQHAGRGRSAWWVCAALIHRLSLTITHILISFSSIPL